ncbi:hypothetical protein C0995_004144 [Termitomyces sp. Mi166|nr:hypothetical protein C0995_004144 [Termitomyces sp. Mi166\
MAPHALNIPTGPCKTQNTVVVKPPHPSFATEAVITTPPNNYGLLGSAKVFPGTGMDLARFLGILQLCFTNQANFSCIADQQGLYEALVLMMQCLDQCLDHLNKALGPSDVEQTVAQFCELQVSSEVTRLSEMIQTWSGIHGSLPN